jgi:hypothetical protein
VKAAEAAKAEVANLQTQLGTASGALANAVLSKDPGAIIKANNDIKAIQEKLAAAQTKVADIEKSTTTTTPGGGGTTTTPGTTTTGGTEDKVKAAEAAKAVVTDLEKQLQVLKDKHTKAAPEAKGDLQKQIDQLQIKLDTAKKDAAAKSGTTPGTDGKIGPNSGDGTIGKPNSPTQTGGQQQQPPKKIFNDNNDRKVKFVDRTKVIYRDNDDTTIDKQYIISSNKNTCPTQSETVTLNGKINPKGIRLLADFDPCRISDGSVTLNMPNTGSIKLALLFIDNAGNNDAGVLVKPLKIQDLSTNQGLFSVELDGNMNGINPLSGQSTSISRINGLALYNDGDQPIQFNSGNIAALTATFTK